MFTRNKWIFVWMCALCASRTGMSLYLSTLSALQPTWTIYLHDYRMDVLWCTLIFFFGDTFSASAMAYHLAKYRSWLHDPPSRRPLHTVAVLNRLLVFAVATGALTSLMDVIIIILLFCRPDGLAFFSGIFIQIHLYSNSVFASLNIRKSLFPNDPSTLGSELPVVCPLQSADSSNVPLTVSKLSEPETHRGEAGRGGIVQPMSCHCHDCLI